MQKDQRTDNKRADAPRQRTRTGAVSLCLTLCVLLVCNGAASAAADMSRELHGAQQALAAGDYDGAYGAYLEHAEQGNPLAQFNVALFFQFGWGRPADAAAACAWFSKAAAGEIPTGAYFHARCLDRGTGGESDPAAAAQWYARAAQYGHKGSLCALGELHMIGRGVDRDPRRAVELCRQAAAEGVPSALLRVGDFHLSDDDSVRDRKAAFAAFEQAAASGAAEGFYRLELMAQAGLAPPAVDPALRQHWREQAAARGYAPAYLATGEGFWQRPGAPADSPPAPEDLARAYLWLQAAAQAAEPPADRERAAALLADVRAVMPSSWTADLNAKVAAHLAKYPPVTQ